MYSQNKLIRNINAICAIVMMVVPVFLFIYTIFYVFSPKPHIFTKELAYEIFPNLKIEYNYLVGIGKVEFAEDFVHYQINIFMFSLYLFCFILFFYLIIVMINWRDVKVVSNTIWSFLKAVVGCLFIAFLGIMYVWGLLSERVGSGRLALAGESDYFITWCYFSIAAYFCMILPIMLVSIVLQYFQTYRGA